MMVLKNLEKHPIFLSSYNISPKCYLKPIKESEKAASHFNKNPTVETR